MRRHGNGNKENSSGVTRREFLVMVAAAAASVACGTCGLFGRREQESAEITKGLLTPTREVSGLLWSHNLLIPVNQSNAGVAQAFFVERDRVFFSTPETHPVSVDLHTGEQLWEWDGEGVLCGTDANAAYVLRSDKRLYALSNGDGTEMWRVVVPEIVEEVSSIETHLRMGRQAVYLQCWISGAGYASLSGPPVIVAIDKKSGAVIWSRQDLRVLANTEHTLLTREWGGAYVSWRGLDLESGAERWSFSPGWPVITKVPYIIAGDSIYFVRRSETGVSSMLNSIVKMEIDSGNIAWESEQTELDCNVLLVTRNAVYILRKDFWSGNSRHVVLDPNTGSELWNWDRATYLVGEIPPTVLLSSEDLGYTWAMKISSGAEVWRNDDLRLNRLVRLVGGNIVAVYNDPYYRNPPQVFGLDPATGQVRWQVELSGVSHKVIVFGDRLVYGADGKIRTIDPETGESGPSWTVSGRPSRLEVSGDILLAQCGSTIDSVGTISAFKF